MMNRRTILSTLPAVIGVVGLLVVAPLRAQTNDKVVVFAAASLKNALDDVNASWKSASGKEATISYAASSALAKQIEAGAPADVFVSADLDWMKYLSDKKLTKPETETRLLGNRIVLIAAKDADTKLDIAKGFDLGGALGTGKLAMADIKAVPAGKYGKAALESLGVWPTVEGKVAQAENVRAALKLVATGEAPLGIVYATDAVAEPNVKVIGTFPEDSHPAIVYPVGVMAASKNADASAFVDYLKSAQARALFEKQGFTVVAPASN